MRRRARRRGGWHAGAGARRVRRPARGLGGGRGRLGLFGLVGDGLGGGLRGRGGVGGGTRGRARGARGRTAPTARRQGVAGTVVVGSHGRRRLSGFGRLEHAGGSPVRLPGAAPGPVTSAARAFMRGAAVRGAGAARELSVCSRRFRTPCVRTAWRKSLGSCAARPRWLPSTRAALRRPSLRGTWHRRRRGGSCGAPPLAGGAASTASRSGASGSVTVPVSSSKSPCASLVTAAGTGGARSATARRPDRTSSGRTAGVTCRTTRRSIAQALSVGLSAWASFACGASVASRLTTAARASNVRIPFLVLRWTSTASAATNASAAALASAASTPSSRSSQTDAVSRSARPEVRDSTASMMSSPVGSDSSRSSRSVSGSRASVSAISRYSASLPVPVGAALAYDTFGCGVNPAEYAMGTSARRSARSKARWKSRWLVNRRRPRLV